MSRYLIEVKKIKKNFNHKNGLVEIFKNVSLGVKAGDLVALVGPSGSGKSIFLHLLSFLDKPTSGQILFLGKESKNFNDEQKILEILNEVVRDLKNYELELRISELESKFSKDLSEETFNQLKELKKQQKIN